MTEPTQQPNEAAETESPNAEPESDVDETKLFDAEYVSKLRDENARRRTEAREATERAMALADVLLTRSIEQATDGVLRDPSDLPREGEYLDEAGTPDLLKIRAAAEALVADKPYLGAVRGDVSQGARAHEVQPTLGSLIRERIGS